MYLVILSTTLDLSPPTLNRGLSTENHLRLSNKTSKTPFKKLELLRNFSALPNNPQYSQFAPTVAI